MDKLSDREWTVLGALWESGGTELGQLVEALRPATGWNRNTVLTYLTRMEAKGLVSIDKDASPHIYRALLSREDCRAQERHSFLHRVYGGSLSKMVLGFVESGTLSPQELEELKALVNQQEQRHDSH